MSFLSFPTSCENNYVALKWVFEIDFKSLGFGRTKFIPKIQNKNHFLWVNRVVIFEEN